jgi:hypothetical protein
MKVLREQTTEKFNAMRNRASIVINTSKDSNNEPIMGPLKSFGELSSSILKLKENFNMRFGINANGNGSLATNSPLKKKKVKVL